MAQIPKAQWTLVQFPNLPDEVHPAARDAIQLLFKGLKDHADAFTALKSQLTVLQNPSPTSASQSVGVAGVTAGGTGAQSLLTNGVLIGQGANPVQAAAPGSGADVLTSNGPGSIPSFQSPLAYETLCDETGTPINGQITTGTIDCIMAVYRT